MLLLFDISANCTSYIPNYTTINPDFQSEIRKNGSNPERVVPVALSKLDLIGEIAVDNVVNCLILRLDVKLDSLDLALEFALIIGFNCLFDLSKIIFIAAELDLDCLNGSSRSCGLSCGLCSGLSRSFLLSSFCRSFGSCFLSRSFLLLFT